MTLVVLLMNVAGVYYCGWKMVEFKWQNARKKSDLQSVQEVFKLCCHDRLVSVLS